MTDKHLHIECTPPKLVEFERRAESTKTVATTLADDLRRSDLVDEYRAEHHNLTAALQLLANIGEMVSDKIPYRVDRDHGNLISKRREQVIGANVVNYLIDCGFTPPQHVFDLVVESEPPK
ncbi:hypothetical protein SEA_GALADRIEL_69 [Gordonia phage Galadriel]|uniref:Uncharacterized protein n=1 Tax=Gordonia phage Galadriel TaxID=2591208 RepID=A0A514DEQ2_9CAUD|nr:hypothetical protein KNU61_gp69 [Gordonia phage Galadriel]QDH92088.1 hypothetical protein SEA_GALADRIEL_69 [Gordonia phage Galadriel]